jgi:hypothetical protein
VEPLKKFRYHLLIELDIPMCQQYLTIFSLTDFCRLC